MDLQDLRKGTHQFLPHGTEVVAETASGDRVPVQSFEVEINDHDPETDDPADLYTVVLRLGE